MNGGRRVVTVLLLASAILFPRLSRAGLLAEARAGLALPVHGDTAQEFSLDLGPGYGLTVGADIWEMLSLELRFDGVWLFGESTLASAGFVGAIPVVFSWQNEARMPAHGITLGPSVTFRHQAGEVYLGFHPGLYLTQFHVDSTVVAQAESYRPTGGPWKAELGEVQADSDLLAAFGFNTQIGARLFLSETFYLGAEVAYHLVFVRGGVVREEIATEIDVPRDGRRKVDIGWESELEENLGVLVGGISAGFRF